MPFTYHELEPDRWRDLTQLLGPNGAQDGCWCMWWRRPHGGKLWEAKKGRPNRDAMRRLVQNRKASGILAYDGDTPVGWCAFGPRLDFPRLETVKAFRRDDIDDVWSVNCFYIARGYRGQGVARGLLAAAIEAMRRRGAHTIEAYPVTTTGKGEGTDIQTSGRASAANPRVPSGGKTSGQTPSRDLRADRSPRSFGFDHSHHKRRAKTNGDSGDAKASRHDAIAGAEELIVETSVERAGTLVLLDPELLMEEVVAGQHQDQEELLQLLREARLKGYEGDPCGSCEAFTLVRNGTCLKCLSCGATSGCS